MKFPWLTEKSCLFRIPPLIRPTDRGRVTCPWQPFPTVSADASIRSTHSAWAKCIYTKLSLQVPSDCNKAGSFGLTDGVQLRRSPTKPAWRSNMPAHNTSLRRQLQRTLDNTLDALE